MKMNEFEDDFLPRRRSKTAPILSHIERVLDGDEVESGENSSDKYVSKKSHDYNKQRSTNETGQLKLQKTRRLSSGGLIRGQRKRRIKYTMQRANTAPEDQSTSKSPEHKRFETEDALQRHDRISSSFTIYKAVEDKGVHDSKFTREVDMNESEADIDSSSSRSELVGTTSLNSLSLSEFDVSELELRSHQDYSSNPTDDRTNAEPTRETETVGCEVDLHVENSIREAKTLSLKVLESEETKESDARLGSAATVTNCNTQLSNDIVPQESLAVKKRAVSRQTPNRRRRSHSLPTQSLHGATTKLEALEECQTDSSMDVISESFETQRELLGTAGNVVTDQKKRQRSNSLPNILWQDKIEEVLHGQPATDPLKSINAEVECASNSGIASSEVVSKSKCTTNKVRSKSLPSALKHLEVPSKQSTHNAGQESFQKIQRTKSLPSAWDIDGIVITFHEKSLANCKVDFNNEVSENRRESSKKEVERQENERKSKFRPRSNSLPTSFVGPGSLVRTMQDVYKQCDRDGFSNCHENVCNAGKQKTLRSKSLPSVLEGIPEIAIKNIVDLTELRELPRILICEVSSGINSTNESEQNKDVEEQCNLTPPPEAPQASHEIGHVEHTQSELNTVEPDSSVPNNCSTFVRRPRNFTMPHSSKMESILEVPNEHELPELDEKQEVEQPREMMSQGEFTNQDSIDGDKEQVPLKKNYRLERSWSVDYAYVSLADCTFSALHVRDTCESRDNDDNDELTVAAEHVELTLTDLFDEDTVGDTLTTTTTATKEAKESVLSSEDFNRRLTKFDSMLASIVPSFLKPDYALSSSTLHQAVAQGDLEYVKSLVTSGLEVNVEDEYGWSPLHVAVMSEHYDTAAYLIEAGADLEAYTNSVIDEYTILKHQVYYNFL